MQVQTTKQYVDRTELQEAVQKIINHVPPGIYVAERGVLETTSQPTRLENINLTAV